MCFHLLTYMHLLKNKINAESARGKGGRGIGEDWVKDCVDTLSSQEDVIPGLNYEIVVGMRLLVKKVFNKNFGEASYINSTTYWFQDQNSASTVSSTRCFWYNYTPHCNGRSITLLGSWVWTLMKWIILLPENFVISCLKIFLLFIFNLFGVEFDIILRFMMTNVATSKILNFFAFHFQFVWCGIWYYSSFHDDKRRYVKNTNDMCCIFHFRRVGKRLRWAWI